ncbi:TPA: response regulator transcription factor, partial [Pseudomonas aeruginosa]|nr:response regulator transcription factor [Pseudomonas aeruginosa]
MTPPTLLVADDHPLFRAAVLHALASRFPGVATVEASSVSTLGAALEQHPDVALVLLDLAMPGARGLSALALLRGERPELPVVVISSNDDPRVIRRAQQFGAAGFIPKSSQVETIGEAVATVLEGGTWFPPLTA